MMRVLAMVGVLIFIAWTWLCIAKMEDDMRFRITRGKR